jgi:hypothetical protein
MVSRSRGWAQHAEVEADERWQQFRLKRIRDFIQEHIGAARRFTDGNSKRLTPRQYDNLSLLIYTSADGKREYIIPEEVFREQACGRMPWSWVLHTLENNGFLNGSPLIARNLVQPFGRVSMVILKPKILKFRTEAEQRADREQAERDVRRVRGYIKQHEQVAQQSAMQYARRLTKQQLSRAPLLAHVRGGKLREFIFSQRRFRREFASDDIAAKAVLQHLRSAGLLNVTDDGGLYVRRKFAAPLGRARVVSIKLAIREYRTEADEAEEREREQRRAHRLAQRRRRRFRSGRGIAPVSRRPNVWHRRSA